MTFFEQGVIFTSLPACTAPHALENFRGRLFQPVVAADLDRPRYGPRQSMVVPVLVRGSWLVDAAAKHALRLLARVEEVFAARHIVIVQVSIFLNLEALALVANI